MSVYTSVNHLVQIPIKQLRYSKQITKAKTLGDIITYYYKEFHYQKLFGLALYQPFYKLHSGTISIMPRFSKAFFCFKSTIGGLPIFNIG